MTPSPAKPASRAGYVRKAMDSLSGGFDAKKASAQKEERFPEEERAEISALIERFANGFGCTGEDDVKSDWEETLTPANFSRLVTLPNNRLIDEQRILALNELYASETQFLQKMQSATLAEIFNEDEDTELTAREPEQLGGEVKQGSFPAKPLPDGLRLLEARGLHWKLRRTVDQLTQRFGLTEFAPTASVTNVLPAHAVVILEDFFQICQFPNDAELHMLVEVLGPRMNVPALNNAFARMRDAEKCTTTSEKIFNAEMKKRYEDVIGDDHGEFRDLDELFDFRKEHGY